MKNIKKIAILIAIIASVCMVFAGCSGSSSSGTISKIKDNGKLVVLTNAEFPPYEYQGDGNEVVGIDMDMSKAIADKLGVELEIVNMDFDGLIPALNGGKGDMVAAGMTVTDERKESVDFSDPYAKAMQLIIVNEGNSEINGEADLAGKVVGVQLGTTGDIYVDENIDVAELKQYKSGLDAATDLKNGRLDAIVIDKLPAESIVAANSGLKTIEISGADDEEYAIAVKKGDESFLKEINNIIAQLEKDGKFAEFAEKHIEAFSS